VSLDWAVVVPVKGRAQGKSRLDVAPSLREELALAFALDAVRAALAAAGVREVVVVTPRADALRFRDLGAGVVTEPASSGLLPALAAGGAAVRSRALGVAFLLGDLPALRPEQLAAALTAAGRVPRAIVPDADGRGTVLSTARPGVQHRPRFGTGSRLAHRRAGYVELALRDVSGLRRDVDTLADLGAARQRGVGLFTARALQALGPRTGQSG
jgi:2-phospho-L-lactate guanylyltransferase